MSHRRFLDVVVVSGVLAAALIYGCVDFGSLVDAAPRKSSTATKPAKKASSKAISVAAECRWATTPIVLDGKADEPAWEKAQVIENFGQPWKRSSDSGPFRGKTKARLLWDGDYLYFHAEMQDADLFADINTHDGMLWTNDTFELFLRPSPDCKGYYEFEVNAANAVLDVFFPQRDLSKGLELLKSGEFQIETKVELQGTLNEREDKDTGWSVEGRIPWVDLVRTGGRPEPGEVWQFNLCRYNHDQNKPVEITVTAPIRQILMPAFVHQIESFAGLKFVGPDAKSGGILHGIARDVPVTTSTVIGSPEPPPPYKPKRLYPNCSPINPILAKPIPGTDQLLVITDNGDYGQTFVWAIKDDPEVKTAEVVRLFATPDNGCATDACFHPKFADNHYVYFGWIGDSKGSKKGRMSRITRYTVNVGERISIDLDTAKTIIEWDSLGHSGMAITFGLDGTMYVTTGDGTSDSDLDDVGQSTNTLLSKVLRIDADHPAEGKTYSVPGDNPYVNDSRFVPETWAYGFRQPWRMTTDAKTGQIWVGQNGQDSWEQAFLIQKGANYGWSVTEGSHPFYSERKTGPHPITKPTIEHPHSEFRSLTGGIVYYGDQFPELAGAYLYGDYATGRIWGMKHNGQNPIWHKELASARLQITSISQNRRGEILICDHSKTGGFYTLERAPQDTKITSRFPRKISESGLFESVEKHTMKPGVFPYSVNAPFWSDGMHKERFVALPPKEFITVTNKGGWNFPDRTVLVKSFGFEREPGKPDSRRWVETRFLTRQEGLWYGYSYRWNAEGTDADLVEASGRDEKFNVPTAAGPREQVWHYPSRAECLSCHSTTANFVLGLCTLQMNKEHDYGACKENQLSALQYAGLLRGFDGTTLAREQIAGLAAARNLSGNDLNVFLSLHNPQPDQREPVAKSVLPFSGAGLSRLANPYDLKEDLNKRARSWLHVNCSVCHVEYGGGNARIELEFHNPLSNMRIVDVKPVHTTFGLPDAQLVAPGAPDRSVLLKRISLRGPNQMPQLSTNLVDEAGVALIREWIQSLRK